jgi:hypothetical protein
MIKEKTRNISNIKKIKMDSILNINLSAARGKDEDFKTYKDRLKNNKRILKLYKTYGREAFQAMFPNGVNDALKNSEAQRQFHHENNSDQTSDNNMPTTNYQQKISKTQNVKSQAPTQMRKSGRGN